MKFIQGMLLLAMAGPMVLAQDPSSTVSIEPTSSAAGTTPPESSVPPTPSTPSTQTTTLQIATVATSPSSDASSSSAVIPSSSSAAQSSSPPADTSALVCESTDKPSTISVGPSSATTNLVINVPTGMIVNDWLRHTLIWRRCEMPETNTAHSVLPTASSS